MSNNRILKLYKVLINDFNINIDDSDDFNKRLKIQKMLYIFQYFGLETGYFYNWYIHGPYSSELADDYYKLLKYSKFKNIKKRLEENTKNLKYNKYFELKICEIKEELRECIKAPELMEYIGSYLFLKKTNPKWSDKKIKENLRNLKPRLVENKQNEAYPIVKKLIAIDEKR